MNRSPKLVYYFSGSMERVNSVCISPNNEEVCSVGFDKVVFFWSLHSKLKLRHIKCDCDFNYSAKYSKNGKLLATGSHHGIISIFLLDTETSEYNISLNHSDNNNRDNIIRGLSFLSNDNHLVSGCEDKTIKRWDLEKEGSISTFKTNSSIKSLCLSSDENMIVTGHQNGNVQIHDLRSNTRTHNFKKFGLTFEVYSVDMDPSCTMVASGTYKKVKLFDIRQSKVVHKFKGISGFVRSVKFHPSGEFLMSGSDDRKIRTFSLQQGGEGEKKVVFRSSDEHVDAVNCICFSSCGKYFVSGGSDKRVILWDFNIPFSKNLISSKNESIIETEQNKNIINNNKSNSNNKRRSRETNLYKNLTLPAIPPYKRGRKEKNVTKEEEEEEEEEIPAPSQKDKEEKGVKKDEDFDELLEQRQYFLKKEDKLKQVISQERKQRKILEDKLNEQKKKYRKTVISLQNLVNNEKRKYKNNMKIKDTTISQLNERLTKLLLEGDYELEELEKIEEEEELTNLKERNKKRFEVEKGKYEKFLEKVKVKERSILEKNSNLCRICYEREANFVFSSCGHFTCELCSSKFENCPFCRKKIGERIRVYRN